MNLNSLIIAADAERARLFRTAQTNRLDTPVELIELDTIAVARESEAPDTEPHPFARQIAERASEFAQYHYCNPVIVAADRAVSGALLTELERALPRAIIRSFVGDLALLSASELMADLQKREAFTPVRYPCPV